MAEHALECIKVCKTCGEEHPISFYWKSTGNKDGLRGSCKKCINEKNKVYDKKRYAENPQKILEKNKKSREKHIDVRRAHCREYGKKYRANLSKEQMKIISEQSMARYYKIKNECPEKIVAQNVISNEIRWGRLVAPKECSACENPTGRIEAHHPSYRFPKKIIWLCSSCHKLLHGGKL